MKRSRGWIFLLGLLFVLCGQAFGATPEIEAEPGTGMAFGAFDITESDLAVTHVVLMRIKPARMYMGSSGEKHTVTYSNGEFFSPNLKPGIYSVMGFFSGGKFFALEKSLRQNTFTVESGKLAYAGSYKLSLKKGGFLRRDKGSFQRVDSPDAEKQLLQWLARELGTTGWAPVVDARLAEVAKD